MSARLLKERTGMRLQICFTTRDEVDSEALDWLQRASDQNH
jgi:hypothetical protein